MKNWTREGFIGQMFKTFAKFIAPSGMPALVLWGMRLSYARDWATEFPTLR